MKFYFPISIDLTSNGDIITMITYAYIAIIITKYTFQTFST